MCVRQQKALKTAKGVETFSKFSSNLGSIASAPGLAILLSGFASRLSVA
jgi:hypothetical protein